MKTQLVLALIALAGTAFVLFNSESTTSNLRVSEDQQIFKLYTQWKQTYNKNTNGDEDQYRFSLFSSNYKFVEQFNSEQTGSLRLGVSNQFAAMSVEEFATKMTADMESSQSRTFETKHFSGKNVAESVDWTKQGAVAPVENQGNCGSCWAFSTKEGLEGIYQIQTGNLEVLSAQQLVDCSTFNSGCNGGDPMTAYRYTQSNGIVTEADYPYVSGDTGKANKCTLNTSQVVFKNEGQVKVSPKNNVAAIQEASNQQPLTIEISAGNIAFQLYTSGVLNSNMCGTSLDHGVLLTGYNNAGNEPYWTIKNSWGTTWGNQGYAQIAITGDGPGMCGIQQYVAYPQWSN